MTEAESKELDRLLDEDADAYALRELLYEMDDRAQSLIGGDKLRAVIAPLITEAEAKDPNPRLAVLSRKKAEADKAAFDAEREKYKPIIAKMHAQYEKRANRLSK